MLVAAVVLGRKERTVFEGLHDLVVDVLLAGSSQIDDDDLLAVESVLGGGGWGAPLFDNQF